MNKIFLQLVFVMLFVASGVFAQEQESTTNGFLKVDNLGKVNYKSTKSEFIPFKATIGNLNESFEGAFLPTSWTKVASDGNDITKNEDQAHTGLYSARFSSYNNSLDYNQYLFTDLQTVATGNVLSFWTMKFNNDPELFEYGIATDISNPDAITWTEVSLGTEWAKTTVDMSAYQGQDVYICFHYYGDYLYYVYLDDVVLETPPNKDASVTAIVSPVDNFVSGPTNITVNLANLGVLDFSNCEIIYSVYDETNSTPILTDQTYIYTSSLSAGANVDITLDQTFTALGSTTYSITASSNLLDDEASANNQASVSVKTLLEHDLAVTAVTPVWCTSGNYTPTVSLSNLGSNEETSYTVILVSTSGGYNETLSGTLIASGGKLDIVFPVWTPPTGTYSLIATVVLSSDENTVNDEFVTTLFVVAAIPGIYEQHEIVSNPGAGIGGADLSELEAGQTIWGTGFQITNTNSVADDFTIPAGEKWAIDGFLFYGYQSFESITPSTFTEFIVRIYDGNPSDGGTIVKDFWTSGDVTMISSSWTGVYRVSNGENDTNRPVMRSVCSVPEFMLTEGTYWIEWAAAGTGSSGPWVPHLQFLDGNTSTGNAQQNLNGSWTDVEDVNPQGMPFDILGSITKKYNITFSVTSGVNPITGAIVNIDGVSYTTGVTGLTEVISLYEGNYTYDVEATDYSSKIGEAYTVFADATVDVNMGFHTGINQIDNTISIFPNPSKGKFTVSVNGTYTLQVIDITGKIISKREITNTETINIEQAGVYMLRLNNKEQILNYKVIVE